MTLAELLDTYWRHAADRAPAFAAALAREEHSLRASGHLARALRAGEVAPDVALPGPDGRTARLGELLRDGPVVLVFYLGRWCPSCTLELRALQRALPEIRALGARLVAVSPEDDRGIALMRERDGLEFDMVPDPGNAIARRFGIDYEVDPTVRDAYAAAGLDHVRCGASAWTLPLPAVFLIAPDGRIAWSHVDANWRRRPEPGEVVQRLTALVRG